MVEISITMDQLPRVLQGFTEQIPFAASQALNDTAFAVKKQMPTLMGDDLTLRNKFTAGGSIRFDKASKTSLVATVGSVAWYLPRNIGGGTSKPKQGIVHEGVKYLLVPAKDRRNRAGRLKRLPSTVMGSAFPIRSGDNLILVIRRTVRGKSQLLPLGLLIPEAQWEAEFNWDREVNEVIERVFRQAFVARMVKAARTAR